jgi:regulatory protein
MPILNKKKIKKPLSLGMRFLSYRPRTVYELESYLKKKGVDKKITRQVITVLLKQNYLNDKNFAKLYIESMVRNKPKSKFAIGFELKKKGIELAISEPELEKYDDYILAIKAIKPKINLWQTLDEKRIKTKLMNFLQYRGVNYDVCITTLNYFKTLCKNSENLEISF